MISLDFSWGLAIYLCVLLAVIFLVWVFSRKGRDKELRLDPKFIWFCSICSYTYINTREEHISTCPRCGSYNKR